MVFPKKLSIFINFPLEFYERWDAAVVLKSPSRYIDYRASSTFRSLFLDAEGYRGKKLYTARKLVEDGRESCGGCDRKFDSATRPPATCAPIRRVNLPTCFASRRIISRARDIDSSPTSTHHRLIGISYALSVRTVTGSHCPVIYFAPHVCIRNILIQAKTKDNSFDYLTFLLFLLHNDRSKFLV